jgi:hypothetical protein
MAAVPKRVCAWRSRTTVGTRDIHHCYLSSTSPSVTEIPTKTSEVYSSKSNILAN